MSANECPKCQGQNVTEGSFHDYGSRSLGLVFRPDGLKNFAVTISGGTRIKEKAFACSDCGLVWTFTEPKELATFVQKHCRTTT